MVYDVPAVYSPLTKVFWKGEFEGKNLFFKKGFPLLIKLEKTSTIGSQLAGDRKFFQGRTKSAKFLKLCVLCGLKHFNKERASNQREHLTLKQSSICLILLYLNLIQRVINSLYIIIHLYRQKPFQLCQIFYRGALLVRFRKRTKR